MTTTFAGSNKHMSISKLVLVMDDSRLNGNLSVNNFASPAIDFGIDINQIDVDRYLSLKKGDIQTDSVNPEMAADSAVQLPVELIKPLNIKGDLKIGQLTIIRTRLTDVILGLNARDGNLAIAPLSANLYQGKYSGDIRFDVTESILNMTFTTLLTGVQSDPLLTDFMGSSSISGIGNFNFNVKAIGINTDVLKKSLTGQGQVSFEDGVLRGVDVAAVLEQVEIMIESKRLLEINRGEETRFDNFTSTLDIANGVVNSNNLTLSAPGIRVTGKGTLINLHNDELKYDLVASADQTSATRREERYNIGGYSIPIQCRGKVGDSTCAPDVGEILKIAVVKGAEKKVGDVLQRALGVERPTQPRQQSEDQSTQQQPDEVPIDPRQELLNKALKSIFN